MRIPLDLNIKSLQDVPYTISYIIRKRQQIDSYRELPTDKQPPEELIFDGTPEELNNFFNRVLGKKEQQLIEFKIDDKEIEG